MKQNGSFNVCPFDLTLHGLIEDKRFCFKNKLKKFLKRFSFDVLSVVSVALQRYNVNEWSYSAFSGRRTLWLALFEATPEASYHSLPQHL